MIWQLCLVSIGLGAGLAMDACAVSMTNGLNNPQMKLPKTLLIAAVFGVFQALMPFIGWLCVTLVVEKFTKVAPAIPYVALGLLAFIGGKMLWDGAKGCKKQGEQAPCACAKLTVVTLLTQAVATSIDALSAGFSLVDIAGTNVWHVLLCVGIIAVVTFAICVAGVLLGKKFGTKLGNKAQIVGGVILIIIGLEIFITGVFL